MRHFDIAIVGGGASGMMAAICAKNINPSLSVAILERHKKVGRKLLATGNGTCNITNIDCDKKFYSTSCEKIFFEIMNSFSPNDAINFFKSIGVICEVCQDGRVYPITRQASSVLDALRIKLRLQGVIEITDFDVSDIRYENLFIINSSITAKKVIIAAGGRAYPSLSSDGKGYPLLSYFGHKIKNQYPSLTQIKTDTTYTKPLAGIKIDGVISNDNKSYSGEILFTNYGLSGPPVLQLSREITIKPQNIFIDFLPQFEYNALEKMMVDRFFHTQQVTLEEFFIGLLNKRVGNMIIKNTLNLSPSTILSSISKSDIIKMCKSLKCFTLKATGVMDYSNAQITVGGCDLFEFDSCLMSKYIKNLYVCGEICDVDGLCGGYNLQWAWASGYVAGINAANI